MCTKKLEWIKENRQVEEKLLNIKNDVLYRIAPEKHSNKWIVKTFSKNNLLSR